MLQPVLSAYGWKEESLTVEVFGSGLINNTWKLISPDGEYILQRVNNLIFKEPLDIAHNTRLIADFLAQHHPKYKFIAPVTAVNGDEMIFIKDAGYFRAFPFVPGSHSKNIVETPEQAYEAASQFGRFTRLLSGIDVNKFRITIPSFHDLGLRYRQFLSALQQGNKQRISETESLIKSLQEQSGIVTEFAAIQTNPAFRLRVTHHDTKISNVLFNADDKGICVIDLDTVMPGYFISDVGDMMRTYLSPVSEEETDFSKIEVRDDFYKAIASGYYNEMKDELTQTEKKYFFYAGKFMIYMQALRFLTDYLNDDVYYGTAYPGQNFARANNQLVLLERLLEKEQVLASIENTL